MEELKREVELDCDPERAWHAMTDEAELGEWLDGEVEADLRPGGGITVRESGGEIREGFFEEVDPGRRVSFWWSSPDESEASRVELELEPLDAGEGCLVRVTETRPMIALERELAEIVSTGPDAGPVARAAFSLA